MKYIIICFSFLLLFSCKEEDGSPTSPVNDTFDTNTATLIKSGTFVGIGHTVTGTVSLYDTGGIKTVMLDPFSTQNGPDLKVYFSADENASSYISLGQLKSTMGKQSYEVPDNSDTSQFKFVLIWCEQFTVLFGKAELQ